MIKRSKVSIFIVMLSFLLLLTACQPTPEKPVVVGRDEDKLAAAIAPTEQAEEEAPSYDAPEHVSLEFDGLPENYSIVFDADVQVPDQTQWPVYTVAKAHVTQQQADAVREALLGDTVLYKPEKNGGREEILRNINDYEEGLKIAIDAGLDQAADDIQKALKDLYAEYEKAESSEPEEANLQFAFMENIADVNLYSDQKEELQGSSRFVWTDEARAKAIAAGCESICGVCQMDSGHKMTFLAKNDEDEPIIMLDTSDVNASLKEVSYSLDEAKTRGDALLKDMGLDFVLVNADTALMYSDAAADGTRKIIGNSFYTLTYKRRIDGVPQDYVLSGINQNVSDEHRSAVPQQETVKIRLDDDGVCGFFWTPMEVIAQETKSAALLPFDDIKGRIAEQLKFQSIWDEQMENSEETNDIVSMRLEVNTLKLSYMLIDKQNDMDSYYLIPVWNVCGDLYYHYRDDYPAGVSEPYEVDENMERNLWRFQNDTHQYSVLTINALDGSVIPRNTWS